MDAGLAQVQTTNWVQLHPRAVEATVLGNSDIVAWHSHHVMMTAEAWPVEEIFQSFYLSMRRFEIHSRPNKSKEFYW